MRLRLAAGSRISPNPRRFPRALAAFLLAAVTVANIAAPGTANAVTCPGGWAAANTGLRRVETAVAYDASRSRLVLFGGQDLGGNLQGDTWEWDGVTWSLRSQSGPPRRMYHCMAYDAARHVTVLFGGFDGTQGPLPYRTIYGDTWEWDGTSWTQRLDVSGPGARWGATMGYDPVRQRIVLYGGAYTGLGGDTWEYDGTSWTPIGVEASAGPLRRAGMAYDAARGRMLMFGGHNGDTPVGGLWAYDGTTWTQLSSGGPAPRESPAMAYDQARGLTVVQGGVGVGGASTLYGDTWLWDGQGWTQTGQGPGGIGTDWNGAYDEARQTVIVQHATGTWEWPGPSLLVTRQPDDASALFGHPVTLVATGAGMGAITYQWSFNGTALVDAAPHLTGSQSSSLSIDALAAGDLGAYQCQITDACQTLATRTASLSLCVVPGAPDAPTTRYVPLGSSTQLALTITGTGPLSYQWRKDDVAMEDGAGILGSQAATLQLSGLTAAAAGLYQLQAQNACGTTLSAGITVVPCSLPVITQQPASGIFVLGSSISVSVGAASSLPLTYQWLKNGVALVDDARISGTTTSTLTLTALGPSDAGAYSARVSSSCGLRTSAAANLAPCTPIVISQAPASAQGPPGSVQSFTVSANIAAPGPLSYHWKKNGVLLSEGGHDHGVLTPTLYVENLSAPDVADYSVEITHFCDDVTSPVAHLALCDAPVIGAQPEAPPFAIGFPVTFSLSVQPGAPVSYLWAKDGAGLANGSTYQGVTTSQLTVSNVSSSSAGIYQCFVTSACSYTASTPVVFSPDCTPAWQLSSRGLRRVETAVAYDASRSRLVLFGGQDLGGNLQGDTWEWDGVTWSLRSQSGPPRRMYHCMAYDAARHVTVLFGGFDGTQGPLPYRTIYGDTWEWDGTSWTQRLDVSGPGARWGATMGYDPVRQRIVLYGGAYTGLGGDTWEYDGTSWTPIGVEASAGPLRRAGMAYDAARGRMLMFGGHNGDTPVGGLWAYDGTTWTQLSSGGPAPRESPAMAYDQARGLTVVQGGVGVGGASTLYGDTWLWDGQGWTQTGQGPGGIGTDWNGAYDEARQTVIVQHATGTWELRTPSPSISVSPASIERPTGADIVLEADASACGASLSYQWLRDGSELVDDAKTTGAGTSELTIHAATPSEAGSYVVRVSGSGAPINSNAATVRICSPPTISSQPADVLVPLGTGTSFNVVASGAEPLVYQWRKNNVAIPGATASTFSVASVALADEGNYSVSVSGCGSTVLSRAATLNVAHAPLVLSENATPLTTYVAHISWVTQDPAQATLEYGPTPALGLLLDGPAPATTGALDVSRASWARFFYRLTWSDAGGVTTGDVHEVVFPALPVTLAFQPQLKSTFIAFPSLASGAQVTLRLINTGPGAITGPLDLTSSTLGAALARDVNGALTTPKRLIVGLPLGSSVTVTPNLTFKRSEIGASAGASVTFRAQVQWWAAPDGTGASTSQLYTQRMTLPKK